MAFCVCLIFETTIDVFAQLDITKYVYDASYESYYKMIRTFQAVAVASSFSDRLCIKTGGRFAKHLSAQNLMSCGAEQSKGCGGGSAFKAWQHTMTKGIVTGGNFGSNEVNHNNIITSSVCIKVTVDKPETNRLEKVFLTPSQFFDCFTIPPPKSSSQSGVFGTLAIRMGKKMLWL